MDMIQRGYVIVDANRGHDETAERDSYTRPFKTFKAAFPTVQDNDTVLVYPGYYEETPVDNPNWWNLPWCGAAFGLFQKNNVTIQGVGRPHLHFTVHANGMVLISCKNCRMQGIQVSGLGYMKKGPGRYYALILLHGINDHHIFDDLDGMDSGDHILAHLAGPRTVFNTTVKNCRFYRCGQMIPGSPWPDGVAVGLGGYGNTIRDNYFEECNRCVEIESGDFPGDNTQAINISVVDNKIYHPWAHPILITPMNINKFVYGKMIVSRNHIQGWGYDPKPDFGGRWAPCGIWITGMTNGVVSENVISDLWDSTALTLEAAGGPLTSLDIHDNILKNIGRTSITLRVTDYEGRGQILPDGSLAKNQPVQFNHIHHNQIEDNGARAIWVTGDYNTIENNWIVRSFNAGLWEDKVGCKGVGNRWRNNRLVDCGGNPPVPGMPPEGPICLLDMQQAADNELIWINKTPWVPVPVPPGTL